MIILDTILTAITYLALCFILFIVGKWVYQLFQRKIKVQQELVEKDNFAFAVAHVGYFIGLLLAIVSAIVGPSEGLYYDIIDITVYGLLAIVLLNFSILINDKIVLSKFSVYKEIITDRNAGTGVVEGASAIATGLIILGAVSGEGGGFLSAIVFWIIGQLLLIITAYVYTVITPYDVHAEIERDNVAVGLGFAGALISIANLIRYGLMIDFFEWSAAFTSVGIDVLIGLAFLPLVRLLTDKILLPGRSLTDELVNQEHPNVGAGLIEAFAYVGGSVLITLCL